MVRVVKWGTLFFLMDEDGRMLGQGYERREDAENDLSDLLRRPVVATRTCMSCQRPFKSEGSHNRLCPPRKKRAG